MKQFFRPFPAGSVRSFPLSTPTNQPGEISLHSLGNRGSLISTSSAASKPRSLVTLGALIGESQFIVSFVPYRVKVGVCLVFLMFLVPVTTN